MSETITSCLIIGASAVLTVISISIIGYALREWIKSFLLRRRRRDDGDGSRTVYIVNDEPPSAEEFANSFSVELIFGGEFDAYLEWLLFSKDGKGILGELEGKHLGGLEELSKIEEVQRLFENVQRQVSTMFYRHLLDTYDYETGIYYANKHLFRPYSIRSVPAPNPQGHADAGTVTDEVNRECGETDKQGEDGDRR